jgi:hypothetical protein
MFSLSFALEEILKIFIISYENSITDSLSVIFTKHFEVLSLHYTNLYFFFEKIYEVVVVVGSKNKFSSVLCSIVLN